MNLLSSDARSEGQFGHSLLRERYKRGRARTGDPLRVVSVLAQRAASEGPRWTRAVDDHSAPIPEEVASKHGRIIDRGKPSLNALSVKR
jgi:hypothetical protein